MNMPQLATAVVQHAKGQHEDSKWDIVVAGMTYEEVRDVITKAGAKTPRGAVRAMSEHLDSLVVLLPV
jgi:hypothetical protein